MSDLSTAEPEQGQDAASAEELDDTRRVSFLKFENLVLPLFFLAVVVFFTIATPAFLTQSNGTAILRGAVPIAIAAIGTTLVLISGGIDISHGPVMAGSAIIAVTMIADFGVSEPVAIATALAAGLAVGTFNGAMAVGARIPAFIATLAVGFIVRGLLFLYTDSRSIGLPTGDGSVLRWLGSGTIGPVPVAVALTVVLVAAFAWLLRATPWGLHCYGVGSSPEASRIAGVRVGRQQVSVYALSGLLSGAAGLVIAGRLAAAGPGFATGAEFDIITAAVLGGTSIYGGRGKVGRSLLGAVILATLANGLVLLNMPSFFQSVAVGTVLLLALAAESLQSRR